MKIFMLVLVFLLQGCLPDEEECPERYIKDYEYITLEDGSVITGAPIYACNWSETTI